MYAYGKCYEHCSVAPLTWLKVGGPARWIVYPYDKESLAKVLKESASRDLPVFVLGAGSNLLLRDGGFPGVILKLGSAFQGVQFHKEDRVTAGAGMLNSTFATIALKNALGGFEFLSTIPGTLGGGIRTNAGCYGGEFSQRVLWIEAMDASGNIHQLSVEDLKFSYRACVFPADWTILSITFQGIPRHPKEILETIEAYKTQRQKTQPVQVRTAGSTFMNPKGHFAWKLLDEAGFRGKVQGEAMFSPLHCNFLVNKGKATALELETLGLKAVEAVYAKTGILLTWELMRFGCQESWELF